MTDSTSILSDSATSLLAALRAWIATQSPQVVSVQESRDCGYGGLLFAARPSSADAMRFTVGLGGSDEVDFYWGDDYRWERWQATVNDVLEVCEAISKGDVIEETWRLAGLVIEKRSYIQPTGRRAGDGSPPLPTWLKRWARLSVRTFSPWVPKEAA